MGGFFRGLHLSLPKPQMENPMPQFILTYHGGSQPSSPEEGKAHMARYMAWMSGLDMVVGQQPLKNTRWAASTVASNLPLLQNRFKANITQVYICENNQCGLPLRSVEEAKIALGLT